MKTKEQILKWLDEQPWADEFYKEVFLNRESPITYDENFIYGAFDWSATKSGASVWTQRKDDFCKWYNSNDKPLSWEEYCDKNPITDGACYIDDSSIITPICDSRPKDVDNDVNVMSKDLCDAFLAYMKLIQLRNAWVKGWDEEYCSYKIEAKDGVILSAARTRFMYGLSFPTPEMADEFMETFRDLLEVAKPLI